MRHRNWMFFGATLLVVATALLWTACGSSSKTSARLVNALPTLGSGSGLDFLVDGASVATGVAYGTASTYASVSSGSRHLQAQVTGTTTIVADVTPSIDSGTFTTMVSFLDSTNANNVLVLTDNNGTPPSGDFNLRIINLCPGVGAEDVYIVTPGTSPNSTTPTFTNLAVGGASNYSSNAAGNWEVIFTTPSQPTFVNASSGSLSFSTGQVRTLLLLNNPGGGVETTLLTDSH
jgi:hypothetical protein